MRLFFALNFSQEVRDAFQQVQRTLRQYAPTAVYPEPDHFHLTLAFLGEVSPSRLENALDALKSLSPVPMNLSFSQVGNFTQKGKDLWWLGPDPCPPLLDLQKELVLQLERQGFSLESRKFQPHVTLARKVIFPTTPPQQTDLLPAPISAPCGTVSLMRSQLTQKGAIYTELARQTA